MDAAEMGPVVPGWGEVSSELMGLLDVGIYLRHSPAIPKGVKVEHEAVIDIQGNY